MAFFIASIDTGFAMADSLRIDRIAHEFDLPKHTLMSHFSNEWRLISSSRRRIVSGISIAIIVIIVGLFASQSLVRVGIDNLIQDIYTNSTYSFLKPIFARVAQNINDVPVENYVQKTWYLYSLTRKYLTLSFIIIWVSAISFAFTRTRMYLWNQIISPFTKAVWEKAKDPTVIFAGIFLGLTCSIRTLGPAAGGLIGLYVLAKHKNHSLPMLLAYFFIGAFTTYVSWPGLWDAPIDNFLASLSLASDFPWGGKVLFGGNTYTIGTLPRSYLPVLLSIQFTLTTLITAVFGLVLTIKNIIKSKLDWMKAVVLLSWFCVPASLVIIFEPKIYDNFRHFLFIIPPIFTFAAIGLQGLFGLFKRPAIQAIVISLLILPNIFTLIKLHPYQYVYYNIFTNGVGGAFRMYEMDYWGTSYREATEYVNQIAPKNSRIIVFGAPHLVGTYARADLQIEKYKKDMELDRAFPTFAILLSRYDKDIHVFPEAENIYIVGRDGAIFAIVKELDNDKVITE
jgi:hypothetical protein